MIITFANTRFGCPCVNEGITLRTLNFDGKGAGYFFSNYYLLDGLSKGVSIGTIATKFPNCTSLK